MASALKILFIFVSLSSFKGVQSQSECTQIANNYRQPVMEVCTNSQENVKDFVMDFYGAQYRSETSCNCILKPTTTSAFNLEMLEFFGLGVMRPPCRTIINFETANSGQLTLRCSPKGSMSVEAGDEVSMTLVKESSPNDARYCMRIKSNVTLSVVCDDPASKATTVQDATTTTEEQTTSTPEATSTTEQITTTLEATSTITQIATTIPEAPSTTVQHTTTQTTTTVHETQASTTSQEQTTSARLVTTTTISETTSERQTTAAPTQPPITHAETTQEQTTSAPTTAPKQHTTTLSETTQEQTSLPTTQQRTTQKTTAAPITSTSAPMTSRQTTHPETTEEQTTQLKQETTTMEVSSPGATSTTTKTTEEISEMSKAVSTETATSTTSVLQPTTKSDVGKTDDSQERMNIIIPVVVGVLVLFLIFVGVLQCSRTTETPDKPIKFSPPGRYTVGNYFQENLPLHHYEMLENTQYDSKIDLHGVENGNVSAAMDNPIFVDDNDNTDTYQYKLPEVYEEKVTKFTSLDPESVSLTDYQIEGQVASPESADLDNESHSNSLEYGEEMAEEKEYLYASVNKPNQDNLKDLQQDSDDDGGGHLSD